MTSRARYLGAMILGLLLVLPAHGDPRKSRVLPPARVEQVVAAARSLEGAHYLFGAGTHRDDAVDCSSLIQKAFRAAGLRLPRSAHQQSRVGRAVPLDRLRRGDRVYFKMTGRKVPIDHTGLYLGEGRMLHAFPGKDVVAEPLASYRRYLVSARR